ncbi:MAG: zinc carboxypeptidase, partial [Reichenbachiella sp.]
IGKGSSYPDVNGAIGILFEQASARGHAQQSENGLLTFPFAIKNHFTTSLSTLKASYALKSELLDHQRKFYTEIPSLASKEEIKGYIFSSPNDNSKIKAFLETLDTHQVDVYKLKKTFNEFKTDESYIIPLKQNQYRMIQGMFETRTQFQDSLFYDVSAWTLPLAFDLNYKEIKGKSFSSDMLGEKIEIDKLPSLNSTFETTKYAYAFHWQDSQSPALLYDIQKTGLRTKVATEPWIDAQGQSFERGSILIPLQNQNIEEDKIHSALQTLSLKHQIAITAITSGNTSGFQLGSPKFKVLNTPKAVLLIGDEVNPYEAGEVWHLLDQRMGMALPMVSIDQLNNMSLAHYNTIVMVSGSYGNVAQAKIKSWVQKGGNIITIRSASKWISEAGLSKIKYKKIAKDSTQKYLAYNTRSQSQGAQRIGGAIFETSIDLTHPIGFGFFDKSLPIFKKGTQFMELAKNPYAQPAHYTSNPLMAGYISEENLKLIPDSPSIGLSAYGKGMIIAFNDNPNFRAYWYGTQRLFLNALFFGGIIEAGSAR